MPITLAYGAKREGFCKRLAWKTDFLSNLSEHDLSFVSVYIMLAAISTNQNWNLELKIPQ